MLSISNLHTRLVTDASFEVAVGQCVCIHGESGSGKTLLLRAIADLDENSGDLSVDGQPRNQLAANAWRQLVTYLPAESHWWEETVADHFVTDNPEYTALALAADIGNWSVQRLSTGERQRLSLLRALDHQPKVLLMDETTANLDEENTRRVEKLVGEKLAEGLAVIWVSHSQAQRQRIADASWMIENGRLVREF